MYTVKKIYTGKKAHARIVIPTSSQVSKQARLYLRMISTIILQTVTG